MEKPADFLLEKFIKNRCSQNEYDYIMSYLNTLSDEELNSFMNSQLNDIEKEIPKSGINYKFNFGKLLSRIKPERKQRLIAMHNAHTIYPIAASVAFLLFAVSAIIYYTVVTNNNSDRTAWFDKKTEAGQKSIITLLDGSTVTLNANSKLRTPKNFYEKTRDVYLEGEAYFDVVHDSTMPFIVHVHNFDVTVLGTEFDVKTFPNENSCSVSLIKGKAKVTSENLKTNLKEVILYPDQRYTYNNTTGQGKVGSFNYLQVTGWKDNILVFDNTSLGEVFIQLERAYGIKFRLEDKSFSAIKIKANFKNASFWTIVKVIHSATNLDYKTVSNYENGLKEIIFYKK